MPRRTQQSSPSPDSPEMMNIDQVGFRALRFVFVSAHGTVECKKSCTSAEHVVDLKNKNSIVLMNAFPRQQAANPTDMKVFFERLNSVAGTNNLKEFVKLASTYGDHGLFYDQDFKRNTRNTLNKRKRDDELAYFFYTCPDVQFEVEYNTFLSLVFQPGHDFQGEYYKTSKVDAETVPRSLRDLVKDCNNRYTKDLCIIVVLTCTDVEGGCDAYPCFETESKNMKKGNVLLASQPPSNLIKAIQDKLATLPTENDIEEMVTHRIKDKLDKWNAKYQQALSALALSGMDFDAAVKHYEEIQSLKTHIVTEAEYLENLAANPGTKAFLSSGKSFALGQFNEATKYFLDLSNFHRHTGQQMGARPSSVFILGRKRKIVYKRDKQFIRYQNNYITLKQAQKLQRSKK